MTFMRLWQLMQEYIQHGGGEQATPIFLTFPLSLHTQQQQFFYASMYAAPPSTVKCAMAGGR